MMKMMFNNFIMLYLKFHNAVLKSCIKSQFLFVRYPYPVPDSRFIVKNNFQVIK